MAYQEIETTPEQLQPGDVRVLIKGYSGNMTSGSRVEREVVAVEVGHKFKGSEAPAVIIKWRDRATGRTSKDYEHAGRLLTVWRKA